MKTSRNQILPRIVPGLLALLAGASLAHASLFVKTNNTDALNLATSWTNNAVPGASDIAQWDNTVSDPNNTTNLLGASLSWSGVRIVDPAGPVQISAGNTLTLGAGGIDMSAATRDLTLSNSVVTYDAVFQRWDVPSGRTLTLAAEPAYGYHVSQGPVEIIGGGTVNLGTATSSIIIDYQHNPYVTYGKNDWAALNGGQVIAATYTPTTTSLTAGVNNDVVSDLPGGSGSAVDVSSLRFNDSTYRTLNVANSSTSRTLTARGVLMTENCVGGAISGTAATSYIRPSRNSTAYLTDFNFIQNSTMGDLTVSAKVSNGSSGAPVRLVKAGPGKMILGNNGGGNGYTGGTLVLGGELEVDLGASLSSGAVTVNAARLSVFSGETQTVASETLNDGATNKVTVTSANGAYTGTGISLGLGNTHLEFSWNTGVPMSITTAPLLATTVTNNSTCTIDVYSGSIVPGTFPLVKYTSYAGTGTLALGFMPPRVLGYISNDVANAVIDLVVTNVNQPIHWAAGDGNWDVGVSSNWKDTFNVSTAYQQLTTPYSSMGDSVLFDDTASGASPITVTLDTAVSPASMTANNSSAKSYTISGNGSIAGNGDLTKSGSGTLTLATTNYFTGGININGGTVNFTTISNLGAGSITFGGGTLQFAPGTVDDISARTVTLGAGGGTLDDGGNSLYFANPIGNGGAGGLTKTGSGTLTLTGTNVYFGNTVIANGTLTLNYNSYISNSAAIIVNSGATLDAATYGSSLILAGSPVQTLAGAGTITGTVISSNGIITPGTNGVVGTLTFGNDLTLAGGTVNLDLSTDTAQSDLMVVSGNLTLYGGTVRLNVAGALTNGVYKLIQYAGGLNSGPGSSANLQIAGFNQAGKSATMSDSTPGEIDLVIADTASDVLVWSGTGSSWDLAGSQNWLNGALPWAYTNGDTVTFDNTGAAQSSVSLQASLAPSSITVSNDAADYHFADGTGVGGGKIAGAASILKAGSGTLYLETVNLNTGALVISNGTVQVGNGAGGDLGPGNVTNNGALVFGQGDNNNHLVAGQISGPGSVVQQGSSTVILAANNTYTGPTTITAGSLQVGNGGAAGSLGSGAVTNDGTLIFNHTGSFAVGNIKTGPGSGGAVTFNGKANVTLNNGNTYINNTVIDNGVVTLAAADAIPSAATVPNSTGWLVLDGGASAGILDLNGFNPAVNALSGNAGTVNGVITNSSASTATNILTVLGSAATTYNGVIAENASGAKLALVLRGANELRFNGPNNYSGGTYVGDTATVGVGPGGTIGTAASTLVLSNGTTLYLHNQGGSGGFDDNAVVVPDGAQATLTSSQLGNGFGGTLTGSATATNLIVGPVSFSASGVLQTSNLLGTVVVQTGAELRFSSTSAINNGGANTTFDIEGTMHVRNNGTVTLGALEGAGAINNPTVSGTGTWLIGTKNVDTVYAGEFSGANNLTKNGTGRLTLTGGTVTYTGNTTVNGGVLAIVDPVSFDNSPNITLGGGIIDVSGRSDGALNLGNALSQILAGNGTINGSLNEASTTTNNLTLGVLNVTNVATINGALNLQINRTNTPNCSELSALSFVNGGAIVLTVANVGPTNLVAGDKFQLFNQPFPGGFVATNLPALPATYLYWTNNLSVDGSIAVGSLVNPNPTNLVTSVSGNVLSLTWPADHTGWTLQMQTNGLSGGLGTNWVDVPGSTSINSTNITVDPTLPTVFYRLKL